MAAGMPLTDADRWPWLERLAELGANAAAADAVLACSALKQSYRDRLAPPARRPLRAPAGRSSHRARMAKRRHRYMPASLLESQFATLEPPADALGVDVRGIADQVRAIRQGLALTEASGT